MNFLFVLSISLLLLFSDVNAHQTQALSLTTSPATSLLEENNKNHHLRGNSFVNNQLPSTTTQFASDNVDSLIRDGSHVLLKGYLKQVFYHDTNTCTHPYRKKITQLNRCIRSVYNTVDPYVIITVIANAHTHQYSFYYQYFTDSNCTNPTTNRQLQQTVPALGCENGVRYQVKASIPPITEEDFQFVTFHYPTVSECNTANASNYIYADFYKLNACFTDWNGDNKYTSCTPDEALIINVYSSNDASCSGSAVASNTYQIHPDQQCVGDNPILGYSTSKCVSQYQQHR